MRAQLQLQGWSWRRRSRWRYRCWPCLCVLRLRSQRRRHLVSHPHPARGLRKAKHRASQLDKTYPGAAASLRQGLEEMFTVARLGTDGRLAITLTTSNPIESMLSIARTTNRNVTRWRDGPMALRWTAAGMLNAERSFRRVKGYKQMPHLAAALHRHAHPDTATVDVAARAYGLEGRLEARRQPTDQYGKALDTTDDHIAAAQWRCPTSPGTSNQRSGRRGRFVASSVRTYGSRVRLIRSGSAAPFGLRGLNAQDRSSSSTLTSTNVSLLTSPQPEKRDVHEHPREFSCWCLRTSAGEAFRYRYRDGRPAGPPTATGGSYTGPTQLGHGLTPLDRSPQNRGDQRHASSGWGEAPVRFPP